MHMKKERNIFMKPPSDSSTSKGACITAEMRKDREEPDWFPDGITFQEKYKKEHKLRQEAEGELTILKGIETNRVKEAQARSNQLQDELDRTSKEKNDLYNRIAELIEANEKEIKNLKWIKDHDYIFLIDENKKLRAEIKKLKEEAGLHGMRKSGM